uniref:Uncharacterized protein n=1 Tax=Chlorobium chlorochromatii (strain CaD3) TaxID=340177 RepID=Q3ARW7_CHLCH
MSTMDTTTNTQELNRIISKLHTERVRYDCIETLGKVNEKEALLEASRYFIKATKKQITEAMQEIEAIKGKKYNSSFNPRAREGRDPKFFKCS